ncbi:Hypothetical protein R9X50_00549100 [Acrodontium crateriforme]|uniref:Uncharacterized protein n=1 Tax=Acrodontium crateriforme TaxID=150365 RepID=A0AAQ3RAX2_9PEZI|nr:Hypothetical protein R9X50_00549100 [Acrodontium crateriforme]
MSLVRALTTRRSKPALAASGMPESVPYIGRAASQRAGKPVVRAQISAPLALLSTSNMGFNNAEAIAGTSPIEFRGYSSSSSNSGDESDSSMLSSETVTDASSIDQSPLRCEPEPNHLSCYFKPAVDTQSPTPSPRSSSRASLDTPKLPTRVPSHSKKAHETLHRKRTIQRIMSPPPSSSHEVSRRASSEFFNPSTNSSFVEAQSPFGNELAQLDEVAEEFGAVMRDAEDSEDAVVMQTYSLAHFSASDYLSEIQGLISETFFADEMSAPAWI